MREGIIIVDKPVGPTSFDVAYKLRKSCGTREIGHCGTLDPLASGVIVVCVGRYTRLVRFLTSDDKRYTARITFGASTPSLDLETEPDIFGDVDVVTEARVRDVLDGMRGDILQVPPLHSAIRKGGERLYEKARRGEDVDVEPRPVVIRKLTLLTWESPHATVDVEVGKGFFVRSLARDLGEALGCPAHLSALRRTESGAYTLEDAVSLDDARDPDKLASALKTGRAAVRGLPHLDVDEALAKDLGHGKKPSTDLPDTPAMLAFLGDAPIAVVAVADGVMTVVRGF